ncbi:hypothetical protein JMJ35_006949 [Cladonia borealis]|uniref:Uncharacterized protein n=1 Tax=Cladonia borealis TaxID=184061 RepID=A0AA39QWG6_9LECA|nr:hypothetical protein JMJ35_006949 [Cladonia borealis]
MADSDPIAAMEAQIARVNAQFEEVIEILKLSPDSRPIFAGKTLRNFSEVLSKTTEDLASYRQRWSMLEQRESLLEKKERKFAEKMTKRLELEQRSLERALELEKWEERLVEKESEVENRENLLTERTRVLDRREINIDSSIIALNTKMSESRIAARSDHNKATYNVGSSPEKGPPAKRQRPSRPAASAATQSRSRYQRIHSAIGFDDDDSNAHQKDAVSDRRDDDYVEARLRVDGQKA